ncbi:MAG: glycosyltransferase [Alphaproteobacteria bacterium]|nr:glycosyltransferase [Alphaproteobacteria bacterium]
MSGEQAGRGLVSVVIPAFNAADYLEECLDSALAQDGVPVEIIVGDDGSTDATPAILDRYAADFGVRVLRPGRNLGPYPLRNRCIEASRGEFIAFLDADDVWHPGKLRAQLAALAADPEAGLCHSFMMRVDSAGLPERRLELHSERYSGWCFPDMLRANGVGTSSVVVRRHVLDRVGPFDERFRYRGDWELWCRIARVAPFAFVARDLVDYRIHDSNIGNNTRKVRRFARDVLDKFEDEMGLADDELRRCLRPARASFHRDHGLMALVDRDLDRARADLMAALAYQPVDPTVWMAILKTVVYRPRPRAR